MAEKCAVPITEASQQEPEPASWHQALALVGQLRVMLTLIKAELDTAAPDEHLHAALKMLTWRARTWD